MNPNPYKSPGDVPAVDHRPNRSKWQIQIAVGGWLIFLLLPSIGVFAGRMYPGPPFLEAPKGDTIFSRVSLAVGVPMEPLLCLSLVGCAVSVVCLPIAIRWKTIAVFAWFPLVVLQILALILTAYPPVT